jgi:hypothetical protein
MTEAYGWPLGLFFGRPPRLSLLLGRVSRFRLLVVRDLGQGVPTAEGKQRGDEQPRDPHHQRPAIPALLSLISGRPDAAPDRRRRCCVVVGAHAQADMRKVPGPGSVLYLRGRTESRARPSISTMPAFTPREESLAHSPSVQARFARSVRSPWNPTGSGPDRAVGPPVSVERESCSIARGCRTQRPRSVV